MGKAIEAYQSRLHFYSYLLEVKSLTLRPKLVCSHLPRRLLSLPRWNSLPHSKSVRKLVRSRRIQSVVAPKILLWPIFSDHGRNTKITFSWGRPINQTHDLGSLIGT